MMRAQQGGPACNLGQRAHPLIKLMEWTYKEEGFILWENRQGLLNTPPPYGAGFAAN